MIEETDDNVQEIGTIGNYYGGVIVKKENGKFYWGVDNYDSTYWEEIPESLYKSLIEFENARKTLKQS